METACEICNVVLNFTAEELKKNKTTDEIIKALDLICISLGGLAIPCRKFVNENVRKIIEMLSQNIDPSQICKDIGACTSRKYLDLIYSIK